MKFLDTPAIIEQTKSIVEDAESYVYIFSPYLQISEEIEKLLLNANKAYNPKEITIVCRKEELSPHEYEKIQQLIWNSTNTIKLYANSLLHAKIIATENEALVSSMNLYKFSEQNYEAGIYFSPDEKSEKTITDDISSFCKSIIDKSIQFDIRYYREENAFSLYEGLKNGKLALFNKDCADAQGNITIEADAIRSAVTGKAFKGIMQLIVQQKVSALKLNDKEIIDEMHAGERNIAEPSLSFVLATFCKYDKKMHCYNYYPASSIVDSSKIIPEIRSKNTPYEKIRKKYKVQLHRNIIINAENDTDPIVYIGKYLAACAINAIFKTNTHTLQKAKDALQFYLSPHEKNKKKLAENIYQFGEYIENFQKKVINQLHSDNILPN